MMKWIAAFLWLGLIACNRQDPMLSKLPADGIILCFGDSLTYGTGVSDGEDYPSILAQLTGMKVINAGIPGEISRNGRQRLPALLEKYQPDALILIHGGNDFLQRLPIEQTFENLQSMISEAKLRQIQVVLFGVPELGLLFLHSAPIYEQLAIAEHIPIDLETLPDILKTNALKSDPVHPNSQGYRRLAASAVELLQSNGAL